MPETPQPRETLIAIGDTAPDFTINDQDRNAWSLSEHLAQGDVVLCFFPFAFTGVCEIEMRCITDEMNRWQAKGARVVGISCDSFAVHKAWAEQLGLKHTLLSDLHRTVCKAFGLFWADMNVSQRGTVVIGRDGKVTWVQARAPTDAMDFGQVLSGVS
jgi:peroxiredoxin